MKKIVVVAQTPPPFHGQAIMQQYIVDAPWKWCEKVHVRMDYSDSINQVGHFQLSKISKLFKIISLIRKAGKKAPIDLLYYPPAGPQRVPLYRDVITLFFARYYARKIVLHFHAGGLCELVERLTWPEKKLVRAAFKNVDSAIVLLPWLKKELDWFSPQNAFVIPNGIADMAAGDRPIEARENVLMKRILFVGNLKDEKGIFVLLKAAAKLKHLPESFQIRIMGEAHSTAVQQAVEQFIKDHALNEKVVLLGSLTGDKKWAEFGQAHIFCLPTFATEAMPVSILEAMMFSLPVISTRWRGIPDMITEGEEGLLVPIHDENALADGLHKLVVDQELASSMGQKGRQRFLSFYHIEKHLAAMETAFRDI